MSDLFYISILCVLVLLFVALGERKLLAFVKRCIGPTSMGQDKALQILVDLPKVYVLFLFSDTIQTYELSNDLSAILTKILYIELITDPQMINALFFAIIYGAWHCYWLKP